MSAMIEKQHTCVNCGGVFRYRVDPSSMTGGLMVKDRKMVANYPCPTCGIYQPEMVGWSKLWHVLAAAAVMISVPVFLGLGFARTGPALTTLAQVAIGVYVILALVHLGTAFTNINADREENLAYAQEQMLSRRLQLVTAGVEPERPNIPRNLTVGHWPGILMVVLGPAALLYPILYLPEGTDLPSNKDLDPAVVFPGDKVKFTLTSKDAGINGHWMGTPVVRVQNAKELGLPDTLPADAQTEDWGNSLKVSKGTKNEPLRPVIQFTLPKDDRLIGKQIRVAVTLNLTYPAVNGTTMFGAATSFWNYKTTATGTTVITLADAGPRDAARSTYLLGMIGAGVLFVGGMWLAMASWALQLRGSESEIVSAPQPGSAGYPSSDLNFNLAPAVPQHQIDGVDETKWGNRRLPR